MYSKVLGYLPACQHCRDQGGEDNLCLQRDIIQRDNGQRHRAGLCFAVQQEWGARIDAGKQEGFYSQRHHCGRWWC